MDVTVRTRNSIVSAAMIKTDTIFHYSHTPIKKWFIVQYLFFVSWGGNNVKLKGVIETDEFYIMIGLKARPYHDKVFNCGRLPRDRRAHGMAIIISDEPQHQRMDSSDSLNFH